MKARTSSGMARNQRLPIAVALLACLGSAGCTVVGFTAGAIHDGKKPDRRALEPPRWETLEPGTDVHILLEDGGDLYAVFRRVDGPPPQLIVEAGGHEIVLPREWIAGIEVKNGKHGKWYGMLCGLAIDVALVYYSWETTSMNIDFGSSIPGSP
jgi:hypothetical protein